MEDLAHRIIPFHDQNGILQECERLRHILLQVSETCRGPLDHESLSSTNLPFVLVLGNHSSGKSSFINYVLQSNVQSTGVAPTDDYFTIIAKGDSDYDRVGQAVMEDPDLGFQGLSRFGPMLAHRTRLKVRSNIVPKDFMIVDSPGMIDSPVISLDNGKKVAMDRGYDFSGVVRWLAERSDVILLFFDPDKPGTTGETLSVLTNALVGYDHKLHIILNKADRFTKIHDFARAYGSLCWNLSKVIPRKDLPQIHTVSLYSTRFLISNDGTNNPNNGNNSAPIVLTNNNNNNMSSNTNGGLGHDISSKDFSIIRDGVLDLEESRNAVLKEVFNAPNRRIDNEISRVSNAAKMLHMHCRVYNEVHHSYNSTWWMYTIRFAISTVSCVGLTALMGTSIGYLYPYFLEYLYPQITGAASKFNELLNKGISAVENSPIRDKAIAQSITSQVNEMTQKVDNKMHLLAFKTSAFMTAMSSLILYIQHKWQQYLLVQKSEYLSTFHGQNEAFRKVYEKELQNNDDGVLSTWRKICDRMRLNVTAEVVPTIKKPVKKEDLQLIHKIIDVDLPNLRKMASPEYPVLPLQDPVLGSYHNNYQRKQAAALDSHQHHEVAAALRKNSPTSHENETSSGSLSIPIVIKTDDRTVSGNNATANDSGTPDAQVVAVSPFSSSNSQYSINVEVVEAHMIPGK